MPLLIGRSAMVQVPETFEHVIATSADCPSASARMPRAPRGPVLEMLAYLGGNPVIHPPRLIRASANIDCVEEPVRIWKNQEGRARRLECSPAYA
jgi:hypothetical protein